MPPLTPEQIQGIATRGWFCATAACSGELCSGTHYVAVTLAERDALVAGHRTNRGRPAMTTHAILRIDYDDPHAEIRALRNLLCAIVDSRGTLRIPAVALLDEPRPFDAAYDPQRDEFVLSARRDPRHQAEDTPGA